MSKVSGVCDLLDHIMMEKMYDKGSYRVSDMLECFEIFKQKTKGVIYQHLEVNRITESNQDFLKRYCPGFDYIKHVETVEDKRTKTGIRENISYTYSYYGKEYSAKEINKRGIYISKEIHFNTLLDIIKYFPYTITASFCDQESEKIYISSKSHVDKENDESYKYGYGPIGDFYDKELSDLYLKVVQKYFLKDLDIRTKEIYFKLEDLQESIDSESYYIDIEDEIDYMHPIKFNVNGSFGKYPHWSEPKLSSENSHRILISKLDAKYYLPKMFELGSVSISYVQKMEFPLDLE